MKKTSFLLLILFFVFAPLLAQEMESNNAPENVQKALKKKFPKASYVEWELDENEDWEANFDMNKKQYSSTFSESGKWISTEKEITQAEIPQNVIASLNKKYGKYKVVEAQQITTEKGINYEMLLNRAGNELEVTVNSKGVIDDSMIEEEVDIDIEEEDDFDEDSD